MQTIKHAAVYFLIVFAAGFVLGTLRVLWVAPQVGEGAAELIETPFMLIVIYFAARFITSHWTMSRPAALAAGVLALMVLLLVEFTVVLGMRGFSLDEYLASRDPVSATVYSASLAIFALMPWFLVIAGRGRAGSPMA